MGAGTGIGGICHFDGYSAKRVREKYLMVLFNVPQKLKSAFCTNPYPYYLAFISLAFAR